MDENSPRDFKSSAKRVLHFDHRFPRGTHCQQVFLHWALFIFIGSTKSLMLQEFVNSNLIIAITVGRVNATKSPLVVLLKQLCV